MKSKETPSFSHVESSLSIAVITRPFSRLISAARRSISSEKRPFQPPYWAMSARPGVLSEPARRNRAVSSPSKARWRCKYASAASALKSPFSAH